MLYPRRVLVGLSGGADSAFAAYLLKKNGYDVYGLHLILPTFVENPELRLSKVQNVAQKLQIPLITLDCSELFNSQVINYFISQYLSGYTPNPCIKCNESVKFPIILKVAGENGIDTIATGHYVRVKVSKKGYYLLRAKDRSKDQSYFLSMVDNDILRKALFPLGELNKQDVLREVIRLKLFNSPPRESQEVCFLAGRDYRELFKASHKNHYPGPIVDLKGNVIGEHSGFFNYTIGQRKGLRIASREPLYVLQILPDENKIVVAPKSEVYMRKVTLENLKWKVKFKKNWNKLRLYGQIRYKQHASPGVLVKNSGKGYTFLYDSPEWAITPGQVFAGYRCDILIVAGWIKREHDAI